MLNVYRISRPPIHRRGAVAVLVALLLIPLFAFAALCVDMGWIAVTQSELQNAADASAAAGARQLVDNYAAYSLPAQRNRSSLAAATEGNATAYSRKFAAYNSAGGAVSLDVLPGDITFGFTDASGQFSPVSGLGGYPNTIQVVVRRDASANGKLPLFFAPLIGKREHALTATASATIYTGVITSFDPSAVRSSGSGSGSGSSGSENGSGSGGGGVSGDDYSGEGAGSCSLLPVAFDVNAWNTFLTTGLSPDRVLHTDSSGSPQIQIYPSPPTAPGNVGLLCIGAWTNSDRDFREWILSGPEEDDLHFLLDSRQLPVSTQAPKAWKGSPGLKSELRREFAEIVGQPRLLPLFKPASLAPYQAASGSGSNATYNIVGFVGVTITQATRNGKNMVIAVQPTSVMDTSAVFDPDTLYPAGAEPATQLKTFTHVAPKFTK